MWLLIGILILCIPFVLLLVFHPDSPGSNRGGNRWYSGGGSYRGGSGGGFSGGGGGFGGGGASGRW